MVAGSVQPNQPATGPPAAAVATDPHGLAAEGWHPHPDGGFLVARDGSMFVLSLPAQQRGSPPSRGGGPVPRPIVREAGECRPASAPSQSVYAEPVPVSWSSAVDECDDPVDLEDPMGSLEWYPSEAVDDLDDGVELWAPDPHGAGFIAHAGARQHRVPMIAAAPVGKHVRGHAVAGQSSASGASRAPRGSSASSAGTPSRHGAGHSQRSHDAAHGSSGSGSAAGSFDSDQTHGYGGGYGGGNCAGKPDPGSRIRSYHTGISLDTADIESRTSAGNNSHTASSAINASTTSAVSGPQPADVGLPPPAVPADIPVMRAPEPQISVVPRHVADMDGAMQRASHDAGPISGAPAAVPPLSQPPPNAQSDSIPAADRVAAGAGLPVLGSDRLSPSYRAQDAPGSASKADMIDPARKRGAVQLAPLPQGGLAERLGLQLQLDLGPEVGASKGRRSGASAASNSAAPSPAMGAQPVPSASIPAMGLQPVFALPTNGLAGRLGVNLGLDLAAVRGSSTVQAPRRSTEDRAARVSGASAGPPEFVLGAAPGAGGPAGGPPGGLAARLGLNLGLQLDNDVPSWAGGAIGAAGGPAASEQGPYQVPLSVSQDPVAAAATATQAGGDEWEDSFKMTQTGTFSVEGLRIKESGLAERQHSKSDSMKANLVRLAVLGQGASGKVYKAIHIGQLKLVAAKVIPVFDTEKRHQLIKELKALYSNLVSITGIEGQSPCPYIVAFYDAFMNTGEGNVSIVLEYMDGGSLQDIVNTGGCASESVLANISWRVLQGLAFVHAHKQIHRDIKPSNLLINHLGDVKVSDFGIVREMSSAQSMANTFVGTLTYMSPERISGEEYSFTSDIWSFGLSIMTCALGHFPLETQGGYWGLLHLLRDSEVPQLPDNFSPVFRDFIAQSLEKDPVRRPTAAALLSHPFVAKCKPPRDRGPDPPPNESQADSPAAHEELEEIVSFVMDYKVRAVRKKLDAMLSDPRQRSQIPNPITLPRIQATKLKALANQLGLPFNVVKKKFSHKQKAFNRALQTEYGQTGAPRDEAVDDS